MMRLYPILLWIVCLSGITAGIPDAARAQTTIKDSNWAGGGLSGSLDGWVPKTTGLYTGGASSLSISTSASVTNAPLVRPTSDNAAGVKIDIFFTAFASSSVGACFRYDGTNWYYLYLNQASGTLYIGKIIGGSFTNIGPGGNVTMSAGSNYALECTCSSADSTHTSLTIALYNQTGTTSPGIGTQIGSTLTYLNDTTTALQLTAQGTGGQSGINAGNASGAAANVQRITLYNTGATTTNITADNAGFVYSGRWNVSGTGASSRAITINAGSRIDCAFTGSLTCTLLFDLTGIDTGSYPEIVYQLDGGGWTRAQVGASGSIGCNFPTISLTGGGTYTLNTGSAHTLSIIAEGVREGLKSGSTFPIDQWSGQQGALKFQGIQIDSTGSLLAQTANPNCIEYLGDSIIAGIHALGTANDATVMAAHLQWPFLTAQNLGMRAITVGFGSQGLVTNNNSVGGNASGNVPLLSTTYPLVYSGASWASSSAFVHPIVTVVEVGANDSYAGTSTSAFQTAYQTLLAAIRAAHPKTLIVCVITAGGNTYAAQIASAISARSAAGDSLIASHNYAATLSGTDFTDGVHPAPQGSAKLAALLTSDIQSDLAAKGIKMQSAAQQRGRGRRLE